jgi:DNA-binding SARP family transcriptional activator
MSYDGAPPVEPGLLGSVLDRLTNGILLVDATGRPLWWNDALARQLGAERLRGAGATCCSLLGCRETWSPAGDRRCMTKLALAGREGVGQRAVRLPGAGGTPPLRGWLTAHSLDANGAPPVVAFELRVSEDETDAPMSDVVPAPRRIATARDAGRPARGPSTSPMLIVGALGPLRVYVGGCRLDGDWLQQRAGQVLRYLVCVRDRPAAPDDIAAAIWPDREPSTGANVRYCIYKVRERLDGPRRGAASVILHSPRGYRLDPQRLKLDVDVFQANVAAGLAAHGRGEGRLAESILTEALALYHGDFLSDEPYAEWALHERDYLRAQAAKALSALGELSLTEGRLGSASVHLERLARLEPFDSRVHELLIEVCLRRGRRTDALRHYSNLRRRVFEAFGEPPGFDLADVAARIARRGPLDARRGVASGGERSG